MLLYKNSELRFINFVSFIDKNPYKFTFYKLHIKFNTNYKCHYATNYTLKRSNIKTRNISLRKYTSSLKRPSASFSHEYFILRRNRFLFTYFRSLSLYISRTGRVASKATLKGTKKIIGKRRTPYSEKISDRCQYLVRVFFLFISPPFYSGHVSFFVHSSTFFNKSVHVYLETAQQLSRKSVCDRRRIRDVIIRHPLI